MNKRMKALMVLGVVALLVGVFNFTPLIRNTPLKDVFTIGMSGVAYAAAPDYPVDGVDDNVQVQEALDALPATGGKIVLYGGNYTFSATVARAIANVTIEGSGLSTYIVHDGSTPLFSDGGQPGWIFQFISVDAGSITRTGTGSRILGCWINGVFTDDTYLMKTDTFAGDVSGNYSATVVGDDSHAHTGATLSGIDISDDTNLGNTSPITLSGDAIGISDASTTAKGAAVFSGLHFSTSGGNVSLLSTLPVNITGNASYATTSGNGGVTGVVAGTGISASSNTGNVTVTNTGVTSLAANSPASVSGATGAVTITIGNATTSVLGAASFASTDFAVTAGAVTLSHQRNIVLMAGSGWSTTTSGCVYSTLVESTTNKQNIWYADFDASTIEYIEWSLVLPNDFATDGTATMTAQFIWTATSGSGNVTWACKWISYNDNEDIDAAYGGNQTANDALGTASRVHVSPVTSAITGGGTSPAAGEFAQVRVYRDATDAADTLAVDARLMSVILTYHGK